MASLNEEALRTQAAGLSWVLRSISVTQKNVLFDLVAQLLDFALSEHGPRASLAPLAPPVSAVVFVALWCAFRAGRLSGNASTPPALASRRGVEECRLQRGPGVASRGFELPRREIDAPQRANVQQYFEANTEIAVPVDSRTQALKLASLIDTQLLCQVVTGPFRRRLLALARRRAEGAQCCTERFQFFGGSPVLARGFPREPFAMNVPPRADCPKVIRAAAGAQHLSRLGPWLLS
ncbi:unnamed protein product [Symbiodinium sp. CCMP2592]|nr:unnamed protein product [Symbiodinium sp. CCMP2592]